MLDSILLTLTSYAHAVLLGRCHTALMTVFSVHYPKDSLPFSKQPCDHCLSIPACTLTLTCALTLFCSCSWLIAAAYWLAGGFIKSGLGSRIAYSMVSMFGKTTLGLTYSLVLGEALLSPAIPSVAARAGGIFFPLAKALCLACGSDPEKGTAKKMGAYVMKTCFQTTCVSSAMFITAMAANPLAVNLAAAEGIHISWGLWALAGLVPGVVCLLTVPLILYALYPPGEVAGVGLGFCGRPLC